MVQNTNVFIAKKEKTFERDMKLPTMWYVRQAKAQTSLRISAV